VSSSDVDTDGDYHAENLTCGWPGTPVRWRTGSASGTITLPSAATISLVVVSHHKLDAGKAVSFTNGITVTVTTPATTPPDDIPLNPWTTITPAAGVTAFDFAVSSNTEDVILGEIIAGEYDTLTLPLYSNDRRGERSFARDMPIEQSSVRPHDPGLSARKPWAGRYVLTQAQLDTVIAWFRAQRNGTYPSVLIPDTSVNDAWVGFLGAPEYEPFTGRLWAVDLTFTEMPRSRW
jgi:hypothetical protein